VKDLPGLRLPPSATPTAKGPRYVYKVMVSQMPQQFEYVEEASIAEAERHGIVVLLVGPA
jgi:hypothetical protein